MQQSALQGGTCDLDTLGQHEAALELARGDAAMQIDPALVVDLLTTNYELTILDLHRKIRVGESGDRQGNAQPVVAELLDVRSEERRVGKECVSKLRSRGSRYN